VDVSDYGVLHLAILPYYFESAKVSGCLAPVLFFALDVALEARFADRLAKRVELLAGALGDQLDAAIRQIAHCAGHFKAWSKTLHRVTKPNALHATGIKNRHSLPAHSLNLRGGDKATSTQNGASSNQ